MNFTREPIIETVITPREGCNLVVRSSRGNGQEEYCVEAVEVVSFGRSLFFRSQERPKSFLVPVSDYEVVELKEARMVLKNVSTERSIKIGGGREAAPSRQREEQQPQDSAFVEARSQERPLNKRDNKRRRGRRGRDRDRSQEMRDEPRQQRAPEEFPLEGPPIQAEEQEKAPSFISKLFPPPPTLIKETLSRYKPTENDGEEIVEREEEVFEETIFEQPTLPDKESDEDEE